MSRFRRCVIVVALLAVILFFPSLLVLGRAPSQDGSTSTGKAAPTQKAALTPDRNRVRVISFSLSDRRGSSAEPPHLRVAIPTQGNSAAMTVISQERGIVEAQAIQGKPKSTSHPVVRARDQTAQFGRSASWR